MKSYSESTPEEQDRINQGDIIQCDLCDNQGAYGTEIAQSTVALASDYGYKFVVCEDCEAIRDSQSEVPSVLEQLQEEFEAGNFYDASCTAARLARLVEECIQ